MRVDNKLTPAEESVSIDTKKTTNVLSILSNDYLPRYIGAMSRNELADCSSSAAAGSLLSTRIFCSFLTSGSRRDAPSKQRDPGALSGTPASTPRADN